MATPTYTLIDSEVLASSASSVEFTSISQDFRDLVLVAEANTSVLLRLNSDSGANYSMVYMFGNGSVALSDASTGLTEVNLGTNSIAQIFDFSASDKHKIVLNRNSPSAFVEARAARWSDTSAVTSLLLTGSVSFTSGSSFYLYGIEA